MILLSDGKIMSIGGNSNGQLGHGDTINIMCFEEIKGIPQNISEIVCGLYHTIILLTDGRIMSCGNNSYGQLGHGDVTNRTLFEEIKGICATISEVVCGDFCTIIRWANGKIMTCGRNYCGGLGHGDKKNRTRFETVKGIPGAVSEIVCGGSYTVIRLADGKIMSCGYNEYGQLGHGNKENISLFEKIEINIK